MKYARLTRYGMPSEKRPNHTAFGLCLLGLMLSMPSALAQNQTGTISGRVVDSTGASIKGAGMQAVDIDRRIFFHTVTDLKGNFEFNVPLGDYQIIAEKNGFGTEREMVHITEFHTAQIDILLGAPRGCYVEVLAIFPTDNIEIDAVIPLQALEPLPQPRSSVTPILRTQTSELSTTIDAHAIESLP
jgi:hypothetical protein